MNAIADGLRKSIGSWVMASTRWLLAAALLSSASVVQGFPASQCAAGRYGADLGCTANDVSITGMRVVGDQTYCVGGTSVILDLEMTVNFAVPRRYDIGIFISNDGKSPTVLPANGGATSCTVGVLPTSSPFLNLDGPTDTCGDGNGTIGGGTGSGIYYMPNVTVPCQSLAGANGKLYIPFAVSWDNTRTPPGAVCTSNLDPFPGSPSKCNAPTVLQGTVDVVVLPDITKTDGTTSLFSGDSTTYSVTITNTTGVALANVVFRDAAVAGIAVNSLGCTAAGGATCPAGPTISAMQGAGITLPSMPVGGSVTFTIGATLSGTPGAVLTNTATASAGGYSNSASDSDTIIDAITLLPISQTRSADKGAAVVYTYTLYNYGPSADTVTLSAASSRGWTLGLAPASVSVPAGGSTTVTLTVNVPNAAAIGNVDVTTITAVSGNYPSKEVTATATTTVEAVLALRPSNTAAGQAGAAVYYDHQVQNNASSAKNVALSVVLSGSCSNWHWRLYAADHVTALAAQDVGATLTSLPANGGIRDFALRVSVPVGAAHDAACTATLTAQYTSGAANAVSVTDVTTVKDLLLYQDPGYATQRYVYGAGESVYAKAYSIISGTCFQYRWYDASNAEVCTPRQRSTSGTTFPDTCAIPTAGPLGRWRVEVWNTCTERLFDRTYFYVGPDHVMASYAGTDPAVGANATVNLALHDRYGHVVPMDALGNVVAGNPPTTADPLMVTVSVGGSAQIVSSTLLNAVITGQTVTGRLDPVSGTASLTITDSVAETVTVTPASYNGALYGSPLRDEQATVKFGSPLSHVRIEHDGSGVTCMPSAVVVKACADSACTSLSTTPVSVTLSPATGWSSGTVTITGSTTVTLSKTTPQTVVLGTSAVAPAPALATRCFIGATEDCNHVFADTGFIVSAATGGAEAIVSTQVAGTSSPTFYLRAVKKGTGAAACEAALTGAQTVSWGYECVDPGACYGTNLMSLNGGTSTVIARNDGGSVASFTPVVMNFDASGNAPFTFNYGDVGQVKLWATKAAGGTLLSALTGATNAFVVKPYDFNVVACPVSTVGACTTTNAASVDGTGAIFVKAGEVFKATVTARAATGTVTPSFGGGSGNATESVVLAQTLQAPVGGVSGTLAGTTVPLRSAFVNGEITLSDLSWNEVGVIALTATNSTYLGYALATSGMSGNIGRFIPDHLDTFVVASASAPMPCPAGLVCPLAYDGFVYSGQPFSVQVFARNLAGATTQNYQGAFARNVALSVWDAKGGATANPGPGGATNASLAAGVFAAGMTTDSSFTYAFTTVPAAPTDIYLRATESSGSDGVTSLRAVAANSVEGGVKVVSGRIRIFNAYGSELLPLTMQAVVQYFGADDQWVASTTDSLTSFDTRLAGVGGNLVVNILAGLSGGVSVVTPGVAGVTAGVRNFVLAKPGETGRADISTNSPVYLPGVAGRATFGVYRGSSEFIYLRESY